MELAQALELLSGVAIKVVGVAAIVPVVLVVLAFVAQRALTK